MNHDNRDKSPGEPAGRNGSAAASQGVSRDAPGTTRGYAPPMFRTPRSGGEGIEPGRIDPESFAPPWSALDVFAIIGLVFLAIMVIFALMGALISLARTMVPGLGTDILDNSLWVTAGSFVLQWAVTLGVAFTYLKIRGYNLGFRTLGFRRPVAVGEAGLLVFGLLFAFYIFLGIYNTLLDQLRPELLPAPQEVRQWYGFSILGFLVAISQVSIITPLVEEMFFRGIIHRGLEKRLGFIVGALLSSLIFALAHVDYTLYIPIFILGFIFAFLTHHTRSLWPSVTAHFLVNSFAVLSQFLLQ